MAKATWAKNKARTTVKLVRTLVGLLAAGISVMPGHLGGGVHATNMESVIDAVTPDPGTSVVVDVVGGDAFIRVRASGVSVEIPGYEAEPYLRIDPDGSVFENVDSVTKLINSTRYGTTPPEDARTRGVKWHRMSTDGMAMWHDHRAHWMSPLAPTVTDNRGTIQKFEIPIVINSVDTVISGTLYLRDTASNRWWLAGLVLLILGFVSMRRQRLTHVVFATSFAAMNVGIAQYFGLPDGARIAPTLAAFGVVALAMAAAGLWWKRHAMYAGALTAGAGIALVTCGWLLRANVTSHYVPGIDGREWIVRVTIASIVAVGVVAVVDGVWKSLMPMTGEATS